MIAATHVFRALDDPTRREILRLLRGGPKSVGEIGASFDVSQATLSHHLKLLREAELATCEARGQQRIYSLNALALDEVTELLEDLLSPAKSRRARP